MIGEPSLFMQNWCWIGLGAGIVLALIALFTDLFRCNLSVSRWYDPSWLAWLGAMDYMFHNFEEYGIDFFGRSFSFPQYMTEMSRGNLGELSYLGCNIVLVWVLGPLLAIAARKYKAAAPSMAVFAILNSITHVAAFPMGGYSPGLVTSLVLFIPVGLWTVYVCYVRERLGWGNFGKTLLVAAIYSFVLLQGISLANSGTLSSDAMQGLVMLADGAICGYLWYLIGKRTATNQ